MTVVLGVFFISVNLLCLAGLAACKPTVKELLDFKGVPILGFLILPLMVPSIVLYMIVKILMWKPFGE